MIIPQVGLRQEAQMNLRSGAPIAVLTTAIFLHNAGSEAAAPIHDCDRVAADPGDPHAAAPGVSTIQDPDTAIKLCEFAIFDFPDEPRFKVQLGNALLEAHARRGTDQSRENVGIIAFHFYMQAAEQGYAAGQFSVGWMYLYGRGIEKNEAEAAKWFEAAALQGHSKAQAWLGLMYADGVGLAKDAAKAAQWFKKAAVQGDAYAQARLGAMYARGQGVPQDYAQAASWLKTAAGQGNALAQAWLGMMYADGTGQPKDDATAAQWFEKAAVQGNTSAKMRLGIMYAQGQGVAQDYGKAAAWLEDAAGQGDQHAQLWLGWLYEHGHGVPKNSQEAKRWYTESMKQGNVEAKASLARLASDTPELVNVDTGDGELVEDGLNNCLVWRPPLHAESTVTWSGPCDSSNRAHGHGVLKWMYFNELYFQEQIVLESGLIMHEGRRHLSHRIVETATSYRSQCGHPQSSPNHRIHVEAAVGLNLAAAGAEIFDRARVLGLDQCQPQSFATVEVSITQGGQVVASGIYMVGSSTWRQFTNHAMKTYIDGIKQPRRMIASKRKFNDFSNGVGAHEMIAVQQLAINPFVNIGKVMLAMAKFRTMIAEDSALFEQNDRPMLVSDVPATAFVREGQDVLLAVKVRGKEYVKLGFLGDVLVPHLQYVDAHFCSEQNCDEILAWSR